MNAINAIPPDCGDPDRGGPDRGGDERAERHARMLRELAELSLALARAAARKALRRAEGEAPRGAPDPTRLFATLSRDIREAIELEAGIAAGGMPFQPWSSVGAPGRRGRDALAGGPDGGDRRATLLRLLTEAVEADETVADPAGVVLDIEEALDEPWVAAAIRDGAPLRVIIEHVCDELGIDFDDAVILGCEAAAEPPDPG